MKPKPDVRVGQVWVDNDKHTINREIRILRIEGDYAIGQIVSAPLQTTKIQLDRLKPTATGYRLKAEE